MFRTRGSKEPEHASPRSSWTFSKFWITQLLQFIATVTSAHPTGARRKHSSPSAPPNTHTHTHEHTNSYTFFFNVIQFLSYFYLLHIFSTAIWSLWGRKPSSNPLQPHRPAISIWNTLRLKYEGKEMWYQ